MEKTYHVYILASGRNGTLYIGVTGHLARRIWEHRNGSADGFTKRYRVHQLVHVEPFRDVDAAIAREKALKKWRRNWSSSLSRGIIRIGAISMKRFSLDRRWNWIPPFA